ncbi:uncharacterized protein LOC136035027 isoform X1 [Artemia franciscana]|uniref:Uncharacterized protein n=1 Tax=Artemia franciscana TaxID=6661 RepID=A0AA88L9M6_ARTSF|nr:hypothetical protein QYM36_002692 [Artemia franciscana]KAK2722218.1 hypothetical protein QYM36_002692 [Artemia franciscana]
MKFLFLFVLTFSSIYCLSGISGFPSPLSRCEETCAELYGGKSSSQGWSQKSSCDQGCRFYTIAQAIDFFPVLDKEISESCISSCHDANDQSDFQRACNKGCEGMKQVITETSVFSPVKDESFSGLFAQMKKMMDISLFEHINRVFFDNIEAHLKDVEIKDTIQEPSKEEPFQISRVWIHTMPQIELKEVPLEIDGDFQVENVKFSFDEKGDSVRNSPWNVSSCLSGKSGLPDWFLLLVLAGAFVYLAYIGGQYFSENPSSQTTPAPYVYHPPPPPYKVLQYFEDHQTILNEKPEKIGDAKGKIVVSKI